jgi:hypothetical protein
MAILSVSFCGIFYWAKDTGWMSDSMIAISGVAIPLILTIGALAMVADIRFRRFRGMPMILLGAATTFFIASTIVGVWIPGIGMAGAIVGSFISMAYLLSPLILEQDKLWGAAERMEKELEVEGLVPENMEEDGGLTE